MTKPYDPHGYERLRELALSNFTHLALVDDTGSIETRIDVTTDSRLINNPDPSTNPLTYTVEVVGTDDDIDPPVTLASTALYESNSDSTPIGTDTAKNATIEAPGDTVTVSHDQHLPK